MAQRPEERQRPYAAPANVIGVIQRCRRMNPPDVIDNEFLRLVGIPVGALGRVMTALRFLRLIDENGAPTDLLHALSAAPENEYREALAGAIRAAYEDDFRRVDPAQDTQAQIVQQFQPYQPRSQTNRMVMLFLQLCREAGIEVLDAPRERQMRAVDNRPRRQTPRPRSHRARSDEATPTPPDTPTESGVTEFGLTYADVAALVEQGKFDSVWSALGEVAKARAKASSPASTPASTEAGGDEEGGGR